MHNLHLQFADINDMFEVYKFYLIVIQEKIEKLIEQNKQVEEKGDMDKQNRKAIDDVFRSKN